MKFEPVVLPEPSDHLVQSEPVRERFAKLKARPAILEVQRLSKRFATRKGPVEALSDISFVTHRREFLCIVGPSGCGKSTLVRILAGLEAASEGAVLIDGKPAKGPGRDRGMVFQSYTLFPWLTVKKNVMFGPLASGQRDIDPEREALQWLDLVGLTRFADAYPHQLSGGMKQRVAIARALVNRPRVLFMDEPFGALDAQTRAQMQSHLLEIWRNVDITIVFITHDLDEAIFLADRILVLQPHPGRMAELIEVPVPRPRSWAQLRSPEFVATRERLDYLIHPPLPPSAEDDVSLPIVRLTDVGDDVE